MQATDIQQPDAQQPAALQPDAKRLIAETPGGYETPEMTQVLTGKLNEDGSRELRADTVAREKPKAGEPRGVVNIQKAKAKTMINEGKGGVRVLPRAKRKPGKTARERAEEAGQMMLKLSGLKRVTSFSSCRRFTPTSENAWSKPRRCTSTMSASPVTCWASRSDCEVLSLGELNTILE